MRAASAVVAYGADMPHERGGVVLHLGPDLRETGGMAQVIHSYFDADLQPWTIEFVATYTNVSRPRQLVRLLASVTALATRPRARIAGVHLHASEGFDLVRTLVLLEIARRRRLPTIVTIHGARFMHEVRRAPRLVGAILRRADAVTVLSDEVRASALSFGARTVQLLPNPAPLRPLTTAVAGRRRVLFAGEIGRRKGVDVLLQAWPEVREAHPDVSLLLLGPVVDPSLTESMPAGALCGGVSTRPEVLEALDAACLAVLPSRAEAMPMFVLEAMAAGIPVVATSVGAVAATVGDAGVIVAPGDPEALAAAIIDLLGKPERLEELSRNGQRRVAESFSAEIFANKVNTLYDSVFGA
jgi:glycosyltransferase involved in cell wall biosynthesis